MRHALPLLLVLAGCAAPTGPVDDGQQLACADGSVDGCNMRVAGPDVNEFSVTVHPTDPLTAIATANDYRHGILDAVGLQYRLWGSIWTTHDGGHTWSHQLVPGHPGDPRGPLLGQEFVGDLVVTYGEDGTAYIAGIAYANTGITRHKLFVMSSPDGDTWQDPVVVDAPPAGFEFHDKPALLATHGGRLVLVWNYGGGIPPREPTANEGDDMRWAVSDDGRTWTSGLFDDAGYGISAALAQAPDGTIHATYRTYDPLGIMHRSSTDGTDWGEETLVTRLGSDSIETNDAGYRTFALPDLAITPDGRLHSIVADKDGAGHGRILVSTSADGGTWDTSRIDGGDDASSRFLAAIDADGDALVAAWLDARGGPDYDLWMATRGEDGAWREQRVSAEPSPPGDVTFIGDYIDVAARDGTVYVAWPDLRSGESELYVARLTNQ